MNAIDYNPTIDPSTSDANVPLIPPRFWWLKRITVAIAAVLIVFTILFFWVEYRSRALLDSRIAEWKAAGQPVDPQDFNRKTRLPDDRNAAKLYNDAAASFTWPADIDSTLNLDDVMDLDKHLDEARKVVAANQSMLLLVHQAGKLDDADWGEFFGSPMITNVNPSFAGVRQCAKVGGIAAGVAATDGHLEGSLRYLCDTLQMAALLEEHTSTLVGSMTAVAVENLAISWIEKEAEWFDVDGLNQEQIERSRLAMNLLINMLLDEKEIEIAWRRDVYLERAGYVDSASSFSSGKINTAAVFGGLGKAKGSMVSYAQRLIARPMWRRDAVLCADWATIAAEIDLARPFGSQAAIRHQDKSRGVNVSSSVLFYPISSYSFGNFSRLIEQRFHNLARQRMAACALAIRMYEWDHGLRPEQLKQLVSDYLPRVPIDPFDPDAGPIRYLPDAMPARLYSVGLNESDDNGDLDFRPSGYVDWRKKDIVIWLDPKPNQQN